MSKSVFLMTAIAALALSFPAAGVTRSSGGTLNMIAWEGYLQGQWVKPFEKQSGCTIHQKYGGSSDEMVTLMRSGGGGQYDMVSASGDASLRLIYGHDVQTVDPSKIPDFKNFNKTFQSPPNNTVGGKHYGISLQWGPNTLLYNTKKVSPAPTSWGAIYSSQYKGKVTVPDKDEFSYDIVARFRRDLGSRRSFTACAMPKLCARRGQRRLAGETGSGTRHAREAATDSSSGLGSPQALHRQACANTSDWPDSLTFAEAHSLHRA